jgi:NAD(P)-dependent dehydrogenase (short-subunit alcohol dehydrogenase family)
MNTLDNFKLNGKVCIITGGAGLLGRKHAEAILEAGGTAVLLDINSSKIKEAVSFFEEKYPKMIFGFEVDITSKESLISAKEKILSQCKKIDVLINNAANNPKMEEGDGVSWTRFENLPEDIWDKDMTVGLKGAFLCSQVFGSYMAERKNGVILNISSDLGIIAPDQRIYEKDGLPENKQMAKPVTYSVIKHGLLGLTKYLATYWAEKGVRVNAICPGGVSNNQDEKFVEKLTNLIPMKRMANEGEYKSAIIFLISDASSYMTGSTIIIDGGRTCW